MRKPMKKTPAKKPQANPPTNLEDDLRKAVADASYWKGRIDSTDLFCLAAEKTINRQAKDIQELKDTAKKQAEDNTASAQRFFREREAEARQANTKVQHLNEEVELLQKTVSEWKIRCEDLQRRLTPAESRLRVAKEKFAVLIDSLMKIVQVLNTDKLNDPSATADPATCPGTSNPTCPASSD